MAKDTAEVKRETFRITHWKGDSDEGFYWLQTPFQLRNRFVAQCDWVIPSRSVEGTYRMLLQGYESMTNCMYNPADEDSTWRRNVGKEVPNGRVQQPSRPGSTTIIRVI